MTVPAAAPPLTERLRALLVNQASEATLTCTFAPGGRFNGVGIRSHLYCANCGQGHLWHEVAAGLQLIATAEEIIRSAGVDVDGIRDRVAKVVADVETATRIVDETLETLSVSGESRGGHSV